jgi:Na+-driven multidrug efflux pump
MVGLSIATAVVVGQNIGAGLTARAEEAARLAAWVGFLGMTAIGLIHLPFVPMMMAALAPGEPAVIKAASEFAYVYFPFLGVLAAPQAMLGAFRGAGSTRHSMTISVVMQWLFQMPAAYAIALWTSLGIYGVWWSYPIANVAALALCLYWFRFGTWRRRLVAEPA